LAHSEILVWVSTESRNYKIDMSNRKTIEGIAAVCAGYFRKTWVHLVVLAVAGFAVHAPALQGELVWDDDFLVRTNALIKSPLLILEAFRHYLFLDAYATHYRPVQNLSYMIDYALWNTNLYGFHLSSLLFHIGSAIFLYLLLRSLLPSMLMRSDQKNTIPGPASGPTVISLVSFLVALLWVVHPVHSAAVDYVSGRADSLAFFFACAAWLLFLKGREVQQRSTRYGIFVLAWICGLLGLCSRESACIWVALFLLYLFGFEKSIAVRRKFLLLGVCLSLIAAYGVLRHLPGPRAQVENSSGWTAPTRAVLMFRALGDYSGLMIYPGNLHMERSVYDPAIFRSKEGRQNRIGLEYLTIIGLVAAAILIYGAAKSGPGRQVRIFGAAWFFLAYLPISNLIDLNATVAEHWLYLPSVGFLIFLAGVVLALPPSWQKITLAFAGCAVIALGVRTGFRSSDWLSNETFARRTIASGGASIRVALLLGNTFVNAHNYVEAERIYRKALQLCPEYPIARNNLADVLLRQGKQKEAEAIFVTATVAAHETRKEYPRTWMLALNLARLNHTNHNDAEAIAVLEKAQLDYPQTWELIKAEGELLREANQIDKAIGLIQPFAKDNWWHYDAAIALGRLYAEKNDSDLADAALRHASRLDVHDVQALNLIAMIGLNQNHLEVACAAQRRAISRQPDEPRQYLLLSSILEKMGRTEEAQATIAQVDRLQALAKSQPAVD
jgi:Flp pilus assembly protein TadD